MPILKKVLVYTMHEDEHALASKLQNAEVTPGLTVGFATDDDIKEFRRKGMHYQEIQIDLESLELNIHRGPSALESMPDAKMRTSLRDSKIMTSPGEAPPIQFPAHFILVGSSPLLETHYDRLNRLSVEVLEIIRPFDETPPESFKPILYIARFNEDTVSQVMQLDFIEGVKRYSQRDTGVNDFTLSSPVLEMIPDSQEIVTYDVIVHQGADITTLKKDLEAMHLPIIGVGTLKIRVLMPRNSAIRQLVADHELVKKVEEFVPPTLHNDLTREWLGFETAAPRTVNIPLTGKGQIVAIADTGIDNTHPDLNGSIVGIAALGRPNNATDPHGHGTHVAGSVAGNGTASNGAIRGTAPDAKIYFQSILDSKGGLGGLPVSLDILFDQAYKQGARVHNNSWGAATASKYTVTSEEVDSYVHSNKDMLIVISAGNEGDGRDPINVGKGYTDLLSIGSPASSKNALTVGAGRSSRTQGGLSTITYSSAWPGSFPHPPLSADFVSGDPQAIAGFSSRGPCDDYRIKPDLVAPGTDIVSTKSSHAPLRNFWGTYPGNAQYAFMGGTSMSAPLVSGCAAVVREFYETKKDHKPSAALVKATLINGCRKLKGVHALTSHNDTPNNDQGFGSLSMTHAIPNSIMNFKLEFYDNWQNASSHFRGTGQQQRFRLQLSRTGWLYMCLAYTDFPGRALQNTLNIFMDEKGVARKWMGNETAKQNLKMADSLNNVQVIQLDSADAGTYTIAITASNILKAPQDFALVITSDDPNLLVSTI